MIASILLVLKGIGAFLAKLPWQVWAFVAAIALAYACVLYGEHRTQVKWDASVRMIASKAEAAVAARKSENSVLKTKQANISTTIQGIYDEEVKSFTAAAATGKRVRIGTAICPSIARSPDTDRTKGSDGADTESRLVSESVQRDIDAIGIEVERALATARAAQEFIRQNGMAP